MTATASPVALPLLRATADSFAEHVARLGPLPGLGGEQVVRAAAAAGLTGRGGAAFPTGRKLAALAGSGTAVVVANGAEGEPASSKDRVLLLSAPHLVLDGLALAARAVGATSAHLYAPADVIATSITPALAQRRDALPVQAVASPDTFVAGQASAVVAAVEGRRAVPAGGPVPVHQRGVGGRPTLVQNVETLAHLALIARCGPDRFRQAGTADEPGTRLVTVSGAVRSPGVLEVPGGCALGDLVAGAGGPSEPVQALLVGGYSGGWVPWDDRTAGLPHSRAALAPYAADPGAGVVIALPASRCGLRAGADVAAYLAGQSAGQCGPCRFGLPALAASLGDLARGRATPGGVAEITRVTGLVTGRGACHHPDGAARLVLSTLRAFAADVEPHLAGRCTTGAPLTPGGPR